MTTSNLPTPKYLNGTNGDTHSGNTGGRTWNPLRTKRAKKSDGSFVGEAPLSKDSQYRTKILGVIPETNFGMREDKTNELVSAAHAAAAIGKPKEEVQHRGCLMFDAVWADQKGRIDARRQAAQRTLDRLIGDQDVLKTERDATKPTIEKRDGKLAAPSGWGMVGFVVVAIALVTVMVCEWLSAAKLRTPELQSILTALVLTSPCVTFALATKLLFRRDSSGQMRKIQLVFHWVGALAVAAWLILLAMNYGTALREDYVAPSKAAAVAFTLAQFLTALAGSSWLSLLLGSMLTPTLQVLTNPDRQRMDKEFAASEEEVNRATIALGSHEAELAAYAASRDSWVAIGVDAFERSSHRLSLIEERIKFIDSN